MDLQVNEFNTRKELETAAQADGITSITGTSDELQSLRLRHGQKVYGVSVIATDYEPTNKAVNTAFRGESVVSKINGGVINTKKRKK